jgi:hypothetical protein
MAMIHRQVGALLRLIVMSAASLCGACLPAGAASDAEKVVAANSSVIGFMAVCVLDRRAAADILEATFDNVSILAKSDLPEGAITGLLLHSPAGTMRVTKDTTGLCGMSVGAVDGAQLQEELRSTAYKAFSRMPHGRFCEVENTRRAESGVASERSYVVNDPLRPNHRFLIEATVWDSLNAAGIQGLIFIVPTEQDCPQS